MDVGLKCTMGITKCNKVDYKVRQRLQVRRDYQVWQYNSDVSFVLIQKKVIKIFMRILEEILKFSRKYDLNSNTLALKVGLGF